MKEKDYEIDLLQVAHVLLRKWWLILLCSIAAAAVAFLFTFYCIKPTYQAEAKLYVNNGTSIEGLSVDLTYSDLTASRSLIETYAVIMTSRTTLEEVIEKAELPYSYEQLKRMVAAGDVDGTEILKITVTSHDPDEARVIANTIVEILPEQISKIMHGSSVEVVDLAVTPTVRSSPSYKKNLVIGFMLGFMASAALILLLDMVIHDVIDDSEWLTSRYEGKIPLLVTIPDAFAKRKKGKYGYYESDGEKPTEDPGTGKKNEMIPGIGRSLDFMTGESYNRLRTNIEFACPKKEGRGRIIGVTSSCPQEGKSFTAINLAFSMAKDGYQVLVLDSDMRRPSVAEKLNLDLAPGLSNVLAGKTDCKINKGVQHANLSIITAGDIPPNPSELIGSERMEKFLDLLALKYDFVLVDLPPVDSVVDPMAVSRYLDGILLVVRHNYTKRREIQMAIRELEFSKSHLLGFVYNGFKDNRSKYYRKDKYSYYK